MRPKLTRKKTTKSRETEQLYYVERILRKRGKGKSIRYRIKWSGWDSTANTWEPPENLNEHIIKEFESNKLRTKRTKRAKCGAKRAKYGAKRAKCVRSHSSVEREENEPVECTAERIAERRTKRAKCGAKRTICTRSHSRVEREENEPVVCTAERIAERIVGKRTTKNGHEYKVKWKGRDESESTWEPLKNVLGYKVLIYTFESQLVGYVDASHFEEGWEADCILGATDVDGDMKFLIKWKNSNFEDLVPSRIARQYIPQQIIKFYEEHTTWAD